jgi:site-specific DNA-methyltransferase (adenine-specific)
MSEPYYQDESVTLYHGDAREILPTLPDASVACVVTDPPYTERTHAKARKNTATGIGEGITEFASITDADLESVLSECGRISSSWVVTTLDYRHAVKFDEQPPRGLKVQRLGVWVKTNPTPQISGDRPAQGWESIAYMHRDDRRSAWHGGGRHGNFVLPIPPPEGHPTAKPLPMVSEWVRLFTNPGDVILDPFAGSGTTLRAALNESRRAIGIELREDYCDLMARRLAQGVLDFEGTA